MIRKIARPMIASVYIADGADSIINSKEHVEGAENLLNQFAVLLPRQYAHQLTKNPEMVVRAVGGTKVGAGTTLALGFFPRASATVLAASAIPTILSRHAFWETQDKEERAARRSGLLTNVAMLGGLLITSMDTQGKPGLRWRAGHAADAANKKVQAALPTKSESEKFADSARDWFEDASERVSDYAHTAQDYVVDNKDDWLNSAAAAATTASMTATGAAHKVSDYVADNKDDWLSLAQDNAKSARKSVVKTASQAQDRADKALATAEKKAGRGAKKANKSANKLQDRADKALAKAQKKIGELR